tara:strand:- start:95 stop:517 length:423 start_codon:yes stop_codon:yes gene_type:complete
MKLFLTIIALILLTSCSKSDEIEVVMPLYKSCVNVLPDYFQSLNQRDYAINHKTVTFSQIHEAHPGLVGSLYLSSNNKEKLEVTINGLKQKSFPKTKLSTDADELGLRVLTSEQSKNQSKETEFIRLNNGQFNYYYPSTN